MEEDDIRKVIRIDEDDREKEEKDEEKGEEPEFEAKKYLTPEEIEEKIDGLRGKLPSFVLKDLKENLSKRLITQAQLDVIISRTVEKFRARDQMKRIQDLSAKIDQLSSILDRSNVASMEIHQGHISKDQKEEVDEKMQSITEKIEEGGNIPSRIKTSSEATEEAGRGRGMLYEIEKPRLSNLPESIDGLMLTLKWLEFLLERVGHTGLENTLEYYVDIGWISDEVLSRILRMARGVKTIHDDAEWRPQGFMTAQDHIQSLLFIERLRGEMVDRNLLDHIDREVSRIKRRSEELHGI